MANISFIKEKLKNRMTLLLSILAISIVSFFLYTSFQSQHQPRVYPLADKQEELQSEESQEPPPENMPQFPALYQSKGELDASVIYDEPSLYGRLTVYDHKGSRTLLIDGIEEGTWDFRKEEVGEPYVQNISLFFQNYLKDVEDVLIIGVGGATLLKEWEGEDFKVDGVEINPKVVEVAEKYFPLPENLDYQIITDDGRHFLRTTDKKYDVIVMDICEVLEHNAHLWTEEFFDLAKAKLKKDNSFLIASLYMMGEGGPYRLGHMVANTLRENFKYIYAKGDPSSPFSIINFFATNESIDPSSAPGLRIKNWIFDLSYPIITDKDTAKIPQYHYPVLESSRETTIRNFGTSFLLER